MGQTHHLLVSDPRVAARASNLNKSFNPEVKKRKNMKDLTVNNASCKKSGAKKFSIIALIDFVFQMLFVYAVFSICMSKWIHETLAVIHVCWKVLVGPRTFF